jgi:transcriptional regulator with XRE-family HTH domain
MPASSGERGAGCRFAGRDCAEQVGHTPARPHPVRPKVRTDKMGQVSEARPPRSMQAAHCACSARRRSSPAQPTRASHAEGVSRGGHGHRRTLAYAGGWPPDTRYPTNVARTLAHSFEDRRRVELAAFLKARRAGLTPEAVGLPSRPRSRTPGLRREDVAELAGVSVAWYTNLEQAREANPSTNMIAALAAALRLSDVERGYLRALTVRSLTTGGERASIDVALLQQLVDRVDAPAYCTDALTQVLAWNGLAVQVFGDYSHRRARGRNLLRLLFQEPSFATRLVDREDYAVSVVQTFRGRSEAYLRDPSAIELVASLSADSPLFERVWRTQTVRRTDTETFLVDHPAGRLTLNLVNFQGVAAQGVRFNAYLPAEQATAERLVQYRRSL